MSWLHECRCDMWIAPTKLTVAVEACEANTGLEFVPETRSRVLRCRATYGTLSWREDQQTGLVMHPRWAVQAPDMAPRGSCRAVVFCSCSRSSFTSCSNANHGASRKRRDKLDSWRGAGRCAVFRFALDPYVHPTMAERGLGSRGRGCLHSAKGSANG